MTRGNRRHGRRAWGGGPSGLPPIKGYLSSPTAYYESASDSGGPGGSSTMTFCAIVYMGSTPASSQHIIDRYVSATGGYRLRILTSGNARFDYVDGGPTNRSAAQVALATNSLNVIWCRLNGSSVDLRVNATDAATGSAGTGYTSPGTHSLGIGNSGGGANDSDEVEIYGACFADGTVLTTGQMTTHYAAIKAAGKMVDFPTGTTFCWTGDDANASVTPWASDTGTEDLDETGTVTGTTRALVWV